MELSSNQPFSNLRSTLILTHILNLTYSVSGNATSLTTSITNFQIPQAAEGTVTSRKVPSDDGDVYRGRTGKSERPQAENLATINKYFTSVIDPVVIAIGIVGNALLALVFTITPLKLRPLSHVLSVLSVADLIYISAYLLVYLSKREVKIYEIPGMCQMLNFILTYSKSVEIWYILLSHLNRLKAHSSPGTDVQERRVFNTKFANVMIAVLVAAPLFHMLWSMETVTVASTTYCLPMRDTILVHLTLRKLEVVGTVFLPLLLVVGVDLMLLVKCVTYLTTKNTTAVEDDRGNGSQVCHTSPSYHGSTVHVAVHQENSREVKVTSAKKKKKTTTGSSFTNMDTELSLALKIAYQILHDTPRAAGCDYDQSCCQTDQLVADLDDDEEVFDGSHQAVSPSALTPDFFPGLSELPAQSTGCLQCPSHLETTTLNFTEPLSSSNSSHRLTEGTISEVITPQSDLEKETKIAISSSHVLLPKHSRALTSVKQYNITNFIFNSIRKYKFHRSLHCDKQRHMVTYDYNQISTQVTTSNQQQSLTFRSSHCRNHEYSSSLSIHSNRTRPDDDVLPRDSRWCTVTTVLLGVIVTISFLPSALTHATRLFLDSPNTRPTAHEMQQAVVFESLVKLNACYKLFLYMVVMPSFRSAVVWLLRHWIPGKLTGMSSMWLCGPCASHSELVYV